MPLNFAYGDGFAGNRNDAEDPDGNSVLYVRGDEDTDGSIRVTPDTGTDEQMEVQLRKNGLWNDTGLQIAASTIHMGRELLVSAAGEYLYTRDQSLSLQTLHPHREFANAAGTKDFTHIPTLAAPVADFVLQGDDTGVITVTSASALQFSGISTARRLLTAFGFKSTQAATSAAKVTIRRDSHTGSIFYQRSYPASIFPLGLGKIVIDGLVELQAAEVIYITMEALTDGGELFFASNAALTIPFLTLDFFPMDQEHLMTIERGFEQIVFDCNNAEMVINSTGIPVWSGTGFDS